ncbi:MAG: fibrinogen-like YCDxxxxGGGW domain-containing protein [Myxococcota bacterium]
MRLLPAVSWWVLGLAACPSDDYPSATTTDALGGSTNEGSGGAMEGTSGDPTVGETTETGNATCSDGEQNGDETDIDCGGATCEPCSDDKMCLEADDCASNVCADGSCAEATCSDGITNGDEADVDCGGPACPSCDTNAACNDASDCTSGVCDDSRCAAAACGDGVANGDETDVDCGGACDGCPDGMACTEGDDCTSLVCHGKTCVLPTCGDNVHNGDETDVDCGGSCGGCPDGMVCDAGDDCISLVCHMDACVMPTCSDGVRNGDETDVDCGGPTCTGCGTNAGCNEASDCIDGVCQVGDGVEDGGGACAAPACGDGVTNGDEDCDEGGTETAGCNTNCSAHSCGDGMVNVTAGEECDDGNLDELDECTTNCLATTCDDLVKNADELDVDCGGRCGAGSCKAGQDCAADSDCASMVCNPASNTCFDSSSCVSLLDSGIVTDGVYDIDPDGAGPEAPFSVYCDMTSSGGGWTLIARFSNADPTNWMLPSGELWYDSLSPMGTPDDPTINEDAQSPAFWTVGAQELRLTRSDEAGDPTLFRTNANCLGGSDFRTVITSYGDFSNGVVWAANAVADTCPGVLEGNHATTNGFAQATCAGNIGAPSSVSFWTDWAAGDGAVMMLGGGGDTCNRADHGIGVTEANDAHFTADLGHDDFGNNGQNYTDPYALNLWVR